MKAQRGGPAKEWVENNVERALRDARGRHGGDSGASGASGMATGTSGPSRAASTRTADRRGAPTAGSSYESNTSRAGRLSRSSFTHGSSATVTRYHVNPPTSAGAGTASVPGSFDNGLCFAGYSSDSTVRPSTKHPLPSTSSSRYYPPSAARAAVLQPGNQHRYAARFHMTTSAAPASQGGSHAYGSVSGSASASTSRCPIVVTRRRSTSKS